MKKGVSWNSIVTTLPDSYIKDGDIKDTAYWTENRSKRQFGDNKVVLVLERPAMSNTFVMK